MSRIAAGQPPVTATVTPTAVECSRPRLHLVRQRHKEGRPCAGRRTEFARPRSRSRRHRIHPCLASRRCPQASRGRLGQRGGWRGDCLGHGCRRRRRCRRMPGGGRGWRPGSQSRGQTRNCGPSQSFGRSRGSGWSQGAGQSRSSVGGQPGGRGWNSRGLSSGRGWSSGQGPGGGRSQEGTSQGTGGGRSQEGTSQGTGRGQWRGSGRRRGSSRGTGNGRRRGRGRGTANGRSRGSGQGTASGIHVRDRLIRVRLRGTAAIRPNGSARTTKPGSFARRVPIARPIHRSPARRPWQLHLPLENGARKG
jgi:hypothetical protein